MHPSPIPGNNQLATWQKELLPPDFILEQARKTGYLQRFRKLNPATLLIVLIFGTSSHLRPSLEEIYRRYIDFDDSILSNEKMKYQSFSNRFNDKFVVFLRHMLDHYIEILCSTSPVRFKKPLQDFKDVIIQDSSIIRLSRKLAERFPAARIRGIGAGLKAHAIFSARSHSVKTLEITGERVHDSKMLKIGPEVKDLLLINDLGYFSIKVFNNINNYGGFFISRLKTNSKPNVVGILSKKGKIKKQIKNPINIIEYLEGVNKVGKIDLICSFELKQPSGKNKHEIRVEFRVICLWDKNKDLWHTYVTNLSPYEFKPEEIYQLYRYRWIIELLFKELKGDYDLGKLLMAREPIAYAHIYAIFIRLMISRAIFLKLVSAIDENEQQRYGPLLWSKVFAEKSHEFLSILYQELFGTEKVYERWNKLEDSLRRLARSRHNLQRLSIKYSLF